MPLTNPVSNIVYPKTSARKTTNQSLTSGTPSIIIYNSEDIDNYNIYDAATGNITITSGLAGNYILAASVTASFSHPTNSGNAILLLAAYKNGTGVSEIGRGGAPNISSFTLGASGSILLPNLVANDIITVRAVPNYISGGSISIVGASLNNLSFYKLP
jgi:hypothetical protein